MSSPLDVVEACAGDLQTLHAVHDGQSPHAPDDIGEVLAVANLDRKPDRGDVAVALEVFDAIDVRLRLRDGGSDLRQHAGTVLDLDKQRAVEIAGHIAVPADRDPALRRLAVIADIRAIQAMHHDAAAGRVVTHDLV